MKKEEILNASRKEHRNKDLAEMEVAYQAGCHASRVGALVCCLLSWLSSMLVHIMIYSPWVLGKIGGGFRISGNLRVFLFEFLLCFLEKYLLVLLIDRLTFLAVCLHYSTIN